VRITNGSLDHGFESSTTSWWRQSFPTTWVTQMHPEQKIWLPGTRRVFQNTRAEQMSALTASAHSCSSDPIIVYRHSDDRTNVHARVSRRIHIWSRL